jgi:hypothetical protein
VKILIGRVCWGAGDWYMLVSIMRMINKYRPDCQIDLSAHPNTPKGWLHLPGECGVRYNIVPHETTGDGYDGHIPHLVYNNVRQPSKEHLLKNMLDRLNERIPAFRGNPIPYDWEGCKCVPTEIVPSPMSGKYVLMPSCGAQTKYSSPKEFPGMDALSIFIRHHIAPVVQIGSVGDPTLAGASHRFDTLPFPEYAALFRGSLFGVFLENGCAHWAGNIGSPHFVLFRSWIHPDPVGVMYPTGIPILAYNMGAEEVFNIIKRNVDSGKIPL